MNVSSFVTINFLIINTLQIKSLYTEIAKAFRVKIILDEEIIIT